MVEILKMFASCVLIVGGCLLAVSEEVNEISGLLGIVIFIVGSISLIQWIIKGEI